MSTKSIHGIALHPTTNAAEREYLGTQHGTIKIEGVTYTVRPDVDGGATLHGRTPRTGVHVDGGQTWQRSDLGLRPDGTVDCCGEPIGRVVDGAFVPR